LLFSLFFAAEYQRSRLRGPQKPWAAGAPAHEKTAKLLVFCRCPSLFPSKTAKPAQQHRLSTARQDRLPGKISQPPEFVKLTISNPHRPNL
jgi:hypothetical protein